MPGLQLTHILSRIFCLPFHTSVFKLFMITLPFQCCLEFEIPVPLYGLCFLLGYIEDTKAEAILVEPHATRALVEQLVAYP